MAVGGTNPKGNGRWEYRGVDIRVNDAGSFEFRVDEKEEYPKRVPTLTEARDHIDNVLESVALAERGDVAEPVLLSWGEYDGEATFRGLHAGNGDALLTLPDGSKLRADRDVIGLRVDSVARDPYLANILERRTIRKTLRELDNAIGTIEREHGVKLRNGRISRDKTRAAKDTVTIIKELRSKPAKAGA